MTTETFNEERVFEQINGIYQPDDQLIINSHQLAPLTDTDAVRAQIFKNLVERVRQLDDHQRPYTEITMQHGAYGLVINVTNTGSTAYDSRGLKFTAQPSMHQERVMGYTAAWHLRENRNEKPFSVRFDPNDKRKNQIAQGRKSIVEALAYIGLGK